MAQVVVAHRKRDFGAVHIFFAKQFHGPVETCLLKMTKNRVAKHLPESPVQLGVMQPVITRTGIKAIGFERL